MKRSARTFGTATAFLQFILQSHSAKTLVVCSTREDFLSRLSFERNNRPEDEPDGPDGAWLAPTRYNLSNSRHTRMVFVPTLMHLRAYLSNYNDTQESSRTTKDAEDMDLGRILVLLNAVILHKETSEFSVQGISKTLALAIDVAEAARCDLLVADLYNFPSSLNIRGDQGAAEERAPWSISIPFLSGIAGPSVFAERRPGRYIKVSKVLSQWLHLHPKRSEAT